MTKLKAGILSAILIVGVATPLVLQYQSQIKLRAENEALRQQVDLLTPLLVENERLSNGVAQAGRLQMAAADPAGELLRLRAEVGRLRAESQELVRLRAAGSVTANVQQGDPMLSAATTWLAKVSLLKERLAQMPEKRIPEMQFLDEQRWLRNVDGVTLETDEDVRRALSNLRESAKLAFSAMIGKALKNYVVANDGQLPTDVTQLQPYFDASLDDGLLQRYRMTRTGKANDLQKHEYVIAERAPVDSEFDTLFQIGLDGRRSEGVGKINTTSTGDWSTSWGKNTTGVR